MIKNWLLLLIPITALSGMVFGTAQQVYRLSANEPQIQLAEDAAIALSAGQTPQSIVSAQVVDLNRSLAPFVIIVDDQGSPIASSAQIDGRTPLPPVGVLEYTREHSPHRVTWQPNSSLRLAAVITRYTSTASAGFVVAGRSLRETDAQIQSLGQKILIGWGVTVVATLAGALILNRVKKA